MRFEIAVLIEIGLVTSVRVEADLRARIVVEVRVDARGVVRVRDLETRERHGQDFKHLTGRAGGNDTHVEVFVFREVPRHHVWVLPYGLVLVERERGRGREVTADVRRAWVKIST